MLRTGNRKNVKKGDVVNAQYTEAMAISVRPAEKFRSVFSAILICSLLPGIQRVRRLKGGGRADRQAIAAVAPIKAFSPNPLSAASVVC